jgi:alkanesulfonate monooxygenase
VFPAALDRGASWQLRKYRDTSSLGLILTHRAGILQPTDAARQLTELDRLSDGRLSIRFPAGLKVAANDQERLPRNPVEMFQQTDEYLVLLKRLWLNDRSFDHEGPFYSVTAGYLIGRARGEPQSRYGWVAPRAPPSSSRGGMLTCSS